MRKSDKPGAVFAVIIIVAGLSWAGYMGYKASGAEWGSRYKRGYNAGFADGWAAALREARD